MYLLHSKSLIYVFFSQFSHSVVSDSLWPYGLQHARLPCPSPNSRAYSNSCPSSQWCHPTISSSVVPFSSRLQSFPASGSFPMSLFFASSGQSIRASASAWILPMNIQDWFPLGLTGFISLQSKGLSRIFSNTTVQILWHSSFFTVQLSYPSSWWCHPTISSSVVPISSCLQSFPASGSFPLSQFFTSCGQNIGVLPLASVLPVNIQDWFPLGWTGLISLQSKGLSRIFSNTTVEMHPSINK